MATGFIVATFGSTAILFYPKTILLLGGADVNENFEIVKKSSLYSDSQGISLAGGSSSSPINRALVEDPASSLKSQVFGLSGKNSACGQVELVGQKSYNVGVHSERDGKYIDLIGKRRFTTIPSKSNYGVKEGPVLGIHARHITETHLELRSIGDEKT